jgi:hypothetical protein
VSSAFIQKSEHAARAPRRMGTSSFNISSGDLRLGVCVCERHHIFWKLQHPDEYIMDWLRRQIIGCREPLFL